MVEQTENPEPEKITGSVDTNIIMMMLQRMKEDKEEIIESMNKNRLEDKEKLDKNIESLRKYINDNCLLYTSRCV